jgi:sugar O-acyltransferase (sialic acid O-acetyltransferase NeuD family)
MGVVTTRVEGSSSGERGELYLFGAGGHAKVILEILEEGGTKVAGLFDDGGTVDRIWSYDVHMFPDRFDAGVDELILAIGSNMARRLKAESLAHIRFGLAVHPATTISRRVTVADGTVIMAGATINADTTIGRHAIVNTCASIDHDCVVDDYAHVSPNATLCGNVRVGEGTHVGAGSVVIPGITIGRWATVGAGSVVIRDVPDGATVVGSPAKVIRAGA